MQQKHDNQDGRRHGDNRHYPRHHGGPATDEATVRGLVRNRQYRAAEDIIRVSLNSPQDCPSSYLMFMAGFSAHNPRSGLPAPDQLAGMVLARLGNRQADQRLCDDLINTAHTVFKKNHCPETLRS